MLDETVYFKTIDSTNLEALRSREANMGRNVLFLTGEQSAGKGQKNRSWESKSGFGLWATLFIGRPDFLKFNLQLLSLYTGIVIQKSLLKITGVTTQLKWPNDIMIEERKCGGILTEIQWTGAQPQSATIGMGLNIKHESQDFSPKIRQASTSLSMAGSGPVNQGALVDEIIHGFFDQAMLLNQPDLLTKSWNKLAWKLNEQVDWQSGDRKNSGIFLGVNQDGHAVMESGSLLETFSSGEIRWML